MSLHMRATQTVISDVIDEKPPVCLQEEFLPLGLIKQLLLAVELMSFRVLVESLRGSAAAESVITCERSGKK